MSVPLRFRVPGAPAPGVPLPPPPDPRALEGLVPLLTLLGAAGVRWHGLVALPDQAAAHALVLAVPVIDELAVPGDAPKARPVRIPSGRGWLVERPLRVATFTVSWAAVALSLREAGATVLVQGTCLGARRAGALRELVCLIAATVEPGTTRPTGAHAS